MIQADATPQDSGGPGGLGVTTMNRSGTPVGGQLLSWVTGRPHLTHPCSFLWRPGKGVSGFLSCLQPPPPPPSPPTYCVRWLWGPDQYGTEAVNEKGAMSRVLTLQLLLGGHERPRAPRSFQREVAFAQVTMGAQQECPDSWAENPAI